MQKIMLHNTLANSLSDSSLVPQTGELFDFPKLNSGRENK